MLRQAEVVLALPDVHLNAGHAASSTDAWLPSYLSATPHREQPLCGNREGWGPLSPLRWDFTPCFLDVLVAAVAVAGLVLGPGAIWYLMKREKEAVKKNWHFWAKMVCLFVS